MKHIFIICMILTISLQLTASNFNEKQKAIIYNEAIKLVQEFERLSNEMADGVIDMDETNKNSQQIIDLFVNRKAIIYNDLDPNHKLSEVYELETYINNLLLWYPDGMKISVDYDKLKAGEIISHDNDIFTVDLMINKKNNGNYLNRQKNELNEELLYRIAFFQNGNGFENFKIAGIRCSKSTVKTNDAHLISAVKSVEFSDKEIALIHEQTKSLMNDYINFINLLADPNETAEDKGYYSISFLGLFKDTTLKVSNDIEPNPQERWISVAEYQNNLVTSYPEGIKNLGLNIDSAEYSKVIAEGDEKYYINGYIDKFFSGKYQNKTVYRDNDKYDFKISFEKDENTFKNFKLASIDKFGVNLYTQNEALEQQALPNFNVRGLQRKGLYVGFSFSGGKTILNDPNLNDDGILTWNIENKNALNLEAQASWYFNTRFALSTAVGYSRYEALAQLYGTFQNDQYLIDKSLNEASYLKNIESAYDSLLTFNYLSIPIKTIFHSNKSPEIWGIYAELGLVASFSIGASHKTSGRFATSGYYEQYPELIQINNSPEWGFVTRNSINEQGSLNVNSIHLALTTAVGVTYPLDYFTTVFVAPEFALGLNSILKATTYTDAFENKTSAQKVELSKYGIKFGISHKF